MNLSDKLNPYWPLIKATVLLGLLAGAFLFGCRYQSGRDAAATLEALEAKQKEVDRKQGIINQWALDFGRLRQESEDNAVTLRRKLNGYKGQLSNCSAGVKPPLTGVFVGMYNDAVLSRDTYRPGPADASTGADPADVIDNAIENGKRWKQCRDQLTRLINAVTAKEPAK